MKGLIKTIRVIVGALFVLWCANTVVAPYQNPDIAKAVGTITMLLFMWWIADTFVRWLFGKIAPKPESDAAPN